VEKVKLFKLLGHRPWAGRTFLVKSENEIKKLTRGLVERFTLEKTANVTDRTTSMCILR
jgi:hypothetical protein